MEESDSSILRVYNCLVVALAIVILSNIWCFYILNKSYETNMTKIMAKATTIEKEIENANHPTVFETRVANDIEDLREYITTQYPKVLEKDIGVIASEIEKHCIKHEIDFPLVAGLIDVESSYNKFARSNKDSYGLMQIRYKVWGPKLAIKQRKDLYRVRLNIGLGVGILKYYIDQNNGNVTKALQDYNGTCNKKFSDKVYRAVKKFTEFRSVYGNNITKELKGSKEACTSVAINHNTEKVKNNGESKNRGQLGTELGKRK